MLLAAWRVCGPPQSAKGSKACNKLSGQAPPILLLPIMVLASEYKERPLLKVPQLKQQTQGFSNFQRSGNGRGVVRISGGEGEGRVKAPPGC